MLNSESTLNTEFVALLSLEKDLSGFLLPPRKHNPTDVDPFGCYRPAVPEVNAKGALQRLYTHRGSIKAKI